MTAFAVLAAGGLISWVIRVAFITLVPSSRFPSVVRRAIEGIGPAAMAALIATELAHQVQAGGTQAAAALGAALIAGMVAWRTDRPSLTVVVGIAAFWLIGSIV